MLEIIPEAIVRSSYVKLCFVGVLTFWLAYVVAVETRKTTLWVYLYIYIYAHTCVAIALRRRNVGFLEIVALGFSAMGRNKMRAAWSKAGALSG